MRQKCRYKQKVRSKKILPKDTRAITYFELICLVVVEPDLGKILFSKNMLNKLEKWLILDQQLINQKGKTYMCFLGIVY